MKKLIKIEIVEISNGQVAIRGWIFNQETGQWVRALDTTYLRAGDIVEGVIHDSGNEPTGLINFEKGGK